MKMERPALIPALLRRELGWPFAVALLIAPVAGVAAAYLAASGMDAGPAPLARVIRRFDITALTLCTLIAVFRICARVERDGIDMWLDGFTAAGARRSSYVLGVTLGAYAWSTAVFILTALGFALAVRLIGGTGEILAVQKTLLPAGIFLVAQWCVWAGLFAVVMRRMLPSAFLALLIPFLLISQLGPYFEQGLPLPGWLHWSMQSLPSLVTVTDPLTVAFRAAAAAATLALAAFAATRLIGRRV